MDPVAYGPVEEEHAVTVRVMSVVTIWTVMVVRYVAPLIVIMVIAAMTHGARHAITVLPMSVPATK